MLSLTIMDTYEAKPRNARYLAERAAIAAHEAETFQPGLALLRHRDACGLVAMLRRMFHA